jgi:hypothetical protein
MQKSADIIALIAKFENLNDLSPKPLIRLVIRFHWRVHLDEDFKTMSHFAMFWWNFFRRISCKITLTQLSD